jgi:ribosomal protein S18 acetylase RimI-like enzyme
MVNVERLDPSRIDELAPLWRLLNVHHRDLAPKFRDAYEALTWDVRLRQLTAKAVGGAQQVFVVRDAAQQLAAYCIASVSSERIGELDSLFVSEAMRNAGVGRALADAAMAWLKAEGATRFRIVVYSGNERALGFYARLGFVPRHVVLELPSNPDAPTLDGR